MSKKPLLGRLFRKRKYQEIEPDEIFLDAHNLPDFNEDQFEGRIEKPIAKRTVLFLGIFFVIVGILFGYRAFNLQIAQGQSFRERSEQNTLKSEFVFADRGVIYDRNEVPLAWNIATETPFSIRAYTDKVGFSNLLGFVRYPRKDKNGQYFKTEISGHDGIESFFNDSLQGINGQKIVETNAKGKIASEGVLKPPTSGGNIMLSIDAEIQDALFRNIKATADKSGFTGGAGGIIDISTGEMIAMTTYPEYSSTVMSDGTDINTINEYSKDKSNPYLNRFLSGLYAPGSIVKPFVALTALKEKIISPDKQILSTGSISVPNPYFPDKPSVFNDWRANGWTDMRQAIAVSSDVYFYEIGGGFEGQKGLGIENINKNLGEFGFGPGDKEGFFVSRDGVIPNPEWKKLAFNGDPWRLGDTYNTSIGQFGFQVTPYQALRATAALVNGGMLLSPTLIANEGTDPAQVKRKIDINSNDQKIVMEGMRRAITDGTLTMLHIPGTDLAGKSGTAQVGVNNEYVNSWIIGFFPYTKPRYAFVVLMERGPSTYKEGAPYVARDFFNWMVANKPDYMQ